MTVLDDAFLSLGSTPVSDDAPAGSSARYEPEYEALEAEVAKLQSMSGEQPDWKQVVAAGTTILQDKSKDLLAASYLTRGLFATDGYAGLAAGLSIIRDMIDTHWDTLFPAAKRMRARANALGWLTGQLGRVVEGNKPSASDREAVARAFEAIQAIEQASNDKMARHAPALGDLRRALKAHHDGLEASAQPAEPEPAAAEPHRACRTGLHGPNSALSRRGPPTLSRQDHSRGAAVDCGPASDGDPGFIARWRGNTSRYSCHAWT